MTPIPNYSHADLVKHWIVFSALLIVLIAYNVVCQIWGSEIQIAFNADDRYLIKNLLYAFSIVLFLIVKLLRHILLTLNRTMPGDEKFARQRYFFTVAVSLSAIETVGLFGFLLFVLGDGYNTLYIFSILAALGLYLHKPNLNEYLEICEAMRKKME